MRRTLTIIIVLIKVADSGIATVLHLEFLRKNARRYIQAATTVYSSLEGEGEGGGRRSGTFPLPGCLAPQTIGWDLLCCVYTDK